MRLTKKEMEAVEDQFFIETTEEEYVKRRPALLRVWKKLCNEERKQRG